MGFDIKHHSEIEVLTPKAESVLSDWRIQLLPFVDSLRRLACETEDEFLEIGSRLQNFYQRTVEISQITGRLVGVVSGEDLLSLIERLKQVMADMNAYLADSRSVSGDGCATLEKVQFLLDQLFQPLEGFQKMNKALRMLSISTKIESARMGEAGGGFVNLAMDVEKLSHQVQEKSSAILEHRLVLASMLSDNIGKVQSSVNLQDAEVHDTMAETAANLQELVAVNGRFNDFSIMASAVASEVAENISEIVSSQQSHDITRQQVEHVKESLDLLIDKLSKNEENLDELSRKALIVEVGNVCELQEAQLRFASSNLHVAVCSIVDSLKNIADRQTLLANETVSVAGMADSDCSSFLENLKQGMMSVTAVLSECSRIDQDLANTMSSMATTIEQITAFVGDIEFIGSEIDLIALNSQVKAAHTGREGAALGVLAEAIKRLSDDAVRETGAVSATLTEIHSATRHLSAENSSDTSHVTQRISEMKNDLMDILRHLEKTNHDLSLLLNDLSSSVQMLTDDIYQTTASINVHEKAKALADEVLCGLERIVTDARAIQPASSEFIQSLHQIEDRYTIESERFIHEAVASKRSGTKVVLDGEPRKTIDESEFGDNVDLF